jgi:hypothetical protein
LFQYFLGSTGVASVSVETLTVVCAVANPSASGTGTATVSATDVATAAVAADDPTILLGGVSVVPDVATVSVDASDAASNELIVLPDAVTIVVLIEDPLTRLWPTLGQRQSQTLDQRYERIHVGETRVRRSWPEDAPRPLRQQEAV